MEVSVIIPVYNAVDFLDQSIQSALDKPEVKEVIAIDDGSTDGSYEKLLEWERKGERVKVLTHPGRERKRAGATRNIGLKVATSEYIAFLDADDYFLPDRFRWTKATFDKYPEVGVVFERVLIFKEEQSPLDLPQEKLLGLRKLDEGKEFENYLTGKYGYSPITGMTFKQELLDKVGLMDESLKQRQDKDFIFRLCLFATVRLSIKENHPVVTYRYHNTNTVGNVEETHSSELQLYNKWLEKLSYLPVSFIGKLIFIRHYTVFKYKSYKWPKIKKVTLYPALYTITLLKNLKLFRS